MLHGAYFNCLVIFYNQKINILNCVQQWPGKAWFDPRLLHTNGGEGWLKWQEVKTQNRAERIWKIWEGSEKGLHRCGWSSYKAEHLFSYKKHLLCLSALLLGWDHAVDGFSLLKLLFHFNHQLDAINHQLDLLHLGRAETVGVGDVKDTTHRGCVHTTWNTKKKNKPTIETDGFGISLIFTAQTRYVVVVPVPRFCRRSLVRISSNLAWVLSLGSLTCTPPRRPVPRLEGQVRMYPRCSFHMKPWLCFLKIDSIWWRVFFLSHYSNIELLISPASSSVSYLLQADAEAPEDLLHVATLLHGDDTQVILLVHPHQEGLVVVVPGAAWKTHFRSVNYKDKMITS